MRTRRITFFRRPELRSGFSLIELLAVIATIAILVSVLLPAIGAVRRSAAISQTHAQLRQYSIAYQAFHADFGYFPSMGADGAEFSLAGNNAVFIQTLSGRTLDGAAADHAYARSVNARGVRYHTFHASEFATDGAYAGQIVDALGNPFIHVVVDRDFDGVIRAEDFDALPPGRRPESLPGRIFFYCTNPEDNPDWAWILPWE